MSSRHQDSLQDQINKLEIEVSQLGGLVKALLSSAKESSIRVEELDDFSFENSSRIEVIEKSLSFSREWNKREG